MKKKSSPSPANRKSKSIKKISSDLTDHQLFEHVKQYYHETLKGNAKAQAYLKKRGLSSPDLIDKFKLGFSDRSFGLTLPARKSRDGFLIREQLICLGVLSETGHERFRGSITVPVYDEQGNCVQLYGRKIGSNLRRGTPRHTWSQKDGRGIWNIEALQTNSEVIVCNSLIDALSFWQAGLHNVIAVLEPNTLTTLVDRVTRILIAFEIEDELLTRLIKSNIDVRRLAFPKGKDANAVLVQSGGDALCDIVESVARHEQSSMYRAGDIQQAPQSPDPSPPVVVPDNKERPTQGHVDITQAISRDTDVPGVSADSKTTDTQPVDYERRALSPQHPKKSDDYLYEEIVFAFGDRHWRVRGLEKNTSFHSLKVNLLVSSVDNDELADFHVDIFDLYSARHRRAFVKQASEELRVKESVLNRDLGRVILQLEELQEQHIQSILEPQQVAAYEMSEQEKEDALELLKDPNLLSRIVEDFEKCGVVGERTNKLTGYLATVSRKLEEPLAVVIQSSSAAGKSSLMEAVLSFVPTEDRIQYSAITGQSLFYMSEGSLKHRILAIAEEEGAERASYALKLLQSEGELTIASTGKESDTGRLVTETYKVEGPVMIFLTTTKIEIDEELLNRCIVLTVDEDRRQTRAIHQLQRENQTLEGLLKKKHRQETLKLHRNAQRLLKPLLVTNPHATKLTFLDSRTRMRRDHVKYLTLIQAVALLHQYQRPVLRFEHEGETIEYVEATVEDIRVANQIACRVLRRSIDELAPQTRRLLMMLDQMVSEECARREMDRADYRFTRKRITEYTGWSYDQVRIHLARLVDVEIVLVHRGGRGQLFLYELLCTGEEEDPFAFALKEPQDSEKASTTAMQGKSEPKHTQSLDPFGPSLDL